MRTLADAVLAGKERRTQRTGAEVTPMARRSGRRGEEEGARSAAGRARPAAQPAEPAPAEVTADEFPVEESSKTPISRN